MTVSTSNPITKINENKKVALYIRLSREDGDKTESLSVANQRLKLKEFIKNKYPAMPYSLYIDDGFTGTNFVEVR